MIEFDEQLRLCYRSDVEVAAYLELLGDDDGAREIREAAVRGQSLGDLLSRPYKQTSHVYGFIEEGVSSNGPIPIASAADAEADQTLVGQQIKVTLDAFQVHSYPGFGTHKVLFDFQGRDQAGSESQDLQFATILHARDKDRAAVSGVPIFTGLTVPQDGLSFKARTILLGNSGDQVILDVLQSSVFKDGLKLMGTIQPALPQLVALAGGITSNLLSLSENEQIQCFDLGLDFSNSKTSARLRKGSYVMVQVPGVSTWRWSDWFFDPHTMSVVDKEEQPASHNVIVFAVSSSGETTARSAIRDEGRAALKKAKGK